MDVTSIWTSWTSRWGRAARAILLFGLLLSIGTAGRIDLYHPATGPAPFSNPPNRPAFGAFGFGPFPAQYPAAGLIAVADPEIGPRGLIALIAEAGRILDLDPTSVPAAHARAVALDRLHLRSPARTAWERVIELNPASPLAEGARVRLAEMDREPSSDARWEEDREVLRLAAEMADHTTAGPLVDRHRQRVRLWLEDELLPAWADAWAAGDRSAAASRLAVVRTLAGRLAERTGDPLLADTVDSIDRASTGELQRFAVGHALHRDARKLYGEQRYEEALPLFRRAAEELMAGGSPFAGWPRLYGATCRYHMTELSSALTELRDLGSSFDPERYPILDGYVHWILSLVRGRSGPSVVALPDAERARARFAETGEWANEVAMNNTAAAILVRTADVDGAWEHLEAGFRLRSGLGASRHGENHLFVAIDALLAEGEASAALPLADELLAEAEARGNPTGVSLALRKRGEVLTALDAGPEILSAHFDAVEAVAAMIADPAHRTVIESETLIARGRSRCGHDLASGIEDLDRAESFVRASDHRHLLIEVLAERAGCRRTAGDPLGAERELDRALAEVEAQRGLIRDERYRAFYVDQARAVQHARVELALEREDFQTAFSAVERLRAPVLLDALADSSVRPVAEEIARCLPPSTALVDLLSLESEVVAWILGPGGVTTLRIPVSRAALTADVRSFRRALATDRTPPPSSIQTRILKRLLPVLNGIRSVVFVPDGPFHDLPFAALQHPETGEFLAERFAVSIAPSGRAFCALQDRERALGVSRPRSVLVIADVPFARRLFPRLAPLPGSGAEARSAADAYPKATLLLGADATAERFLAEAGAHDVVHVATHAVESRNDPSETTLLLAPAPSGRDDGILPANDLQLDGPVDTRVVVLAACRTAGGRISASEGPLNLARPFLAAGVPTVVATLWELDEQTSAVFSDRFHAALAVGHSPLTAFHSAQLALIRHPDPHIRSPRSWGGLVLIGALGEADSAWP